MGAISLFIKPDGEHMGIKTLEDLQAKIEEIDEQESQDFVEDPKEEEEEVEVEEEKEVIEEEKKDEEEGEPSSEEKTGTEEEQKEELEKEDIEEEKTPKYEADLKFKAMKEEYELPEYFKDVITSKEQEEEIKKIYSKAHGLDHFTQKNESLKQQVDNYSPIIQSVNQFNSLLDKGQIHEAMKTANITDDNILQLASKIIQIRELTPDQQQAYNSQIESNHRLHQLEVQNQNLQQQFAQQAEVQQVTELDSLLTSADIGQMANVYDQRMGSTGAFREAVINHAAMIEYQTQGRPEGPTILSPKEAVDRVVKLSGLQFTPNTQQVGDVGQQTQQTPTNQTVVVKKEVPTLPNVRSGGKSPVKKKVKNMADLIALRDGLDDY